MAAIARPPPAQTEASPTESSGRRPRVPAAAGVVALLGIATVLSRLPFLTPRLAHWDAVNYALGLHEFSVAAHQPHPPGSPYFILLGRAALAITGDDNSALILVSLVASAGAVLGEYALARLLFGRRAALLSALVLMTQPVFWGYGTMATAWTLLAGLAIAVGLVCAALMGGRRGLVIPSALLMGAASGFRLDVTAFLGPLWLYAVWRAEPDLRRRIVAIALVAAGVLVWLAPVAAGSGGLSAWWMRLVALLPSTDTPPGTLAMQLAANTAISFGTLAFTIGPTLAAAMICDWRKTPAALRTNPKALWMLWILPAFVFLWLVDSSEPGHDLIFVGALCALGAAAIVNAAQKPIKLLLATGALTGAQALVFLFGAPVYDRPLAWTADSMLLNVTAPGLRMQQRSLDAALQTIRASFDPGKTVVVTLIDQDPYRFMMYYLPEYTVIRLDARGQRVLVARERRQGNWQLAPGCLGPQGAPASVRSVVWVLSASPEPGPIPPNAQLASNNAQRPFEVWVTSVSGGDQPDYLGIRLGGDCGPASAQDAGRAG